MRETRIGGTTLRLVEGDITRQPADAIVNAANEQLAGGGGVDGAIHRVGGPSIMEECRAIGRCPPGSVVATTAGRLPAKYVLHTVGPVWQGGRKGEADVLARCYASCLIKASELGLTSIVFPSISTGAYGYPLNEAARVAMRTVVGRLQIAPGGITRVTFCLLGDAAYRAYDQAMTSLLGGRR